MRTRFLMIIGILLIATFTISSAYASCGSDSDSLESCDDPEFLVEKYAQIAEINTDAEDEMKKLQMDLANELQKQNPDQNTIQALHDAISEQEQILLETTKELSEIQKLLTQKIQINPDLKKKLEIARDILHENQDIIPWTGLGVSSTEQAVTISIDAENPEEYRNIIEKLVGKDVPVIINKGGNPFLSGNLLPPLKQFESGVPVDEIKCNKPLVLVTKHDGSPACIKESTINKLIKRDWTNLAPKTCPDDYSYNETLFKCVVSCEGELVYNGYTDSCTTAFELKYHGFCNEGFTYQPLTHTCLAENNPDDGIGNLEHTPLKDPPRTAPPEPEPEPEPIPEEESLRKEKQDQAKIQTQKEIMIDYRGNQHQIDAINKYREEFDSGYFLEQFVIPNKQNFEKGELINFVVMQWGYLPEKCISYDVKGFFKPYENYDPFYTEKISELEDTQECDSVIASDSNGYVVVNMNPLPGLPEEHLICNNPGEYRILVRNLDDESQVEWGYYTCQRDKLVGEPQPWMSIPE